MGVTSTATVGPKLDPPSLRFQPAAPPSSTTAAGSLSTGWPKGFPEQRNKEANQTDFVAFIRCAHISEEIHLAQAHGPQPHRHWRHFQLVGQPQLAPLAGARTAGHGDTLRGVVFGWLL